MNQHLDEATEFAWVREWPLANTLVPELSPDDALRAIVYAFRAGAMDLSVSGYAVGLSVLTIAEATLIRRGIPLAEVGAL